MTKKNIKALQARIRELLRLVNISEQRIRNALSGIPEEYTEEFEQDPKGGFFLAKIILTAYFEGDRPFAPHSPEHRRILKNVIALM